jgi:ribonuclease HII
MSKGKETQDDHGIDRLRVERSLWGMGFQRVMGLDEVGRGCLAGPVVAAGVILDQNQTHPSLRDSKKIGESERIYLADWIAKNAIYFHISIQEIHVIDEINILNASLKAMLECAEREEARPDYLLIDGNRFPSCLIPHKCIIKGDDHSASIAAASILAKTYRDTLMKELHHEFPFYGWEKNVGYPTVQHYQALEKYGYCVHHRQSFSLRTNKKYQPA